MTLYLKSCPRCRGDITLDEDQYGRYMECLQCGFMIREKDKATELICKRYSREQTKPVAAQQA